MLPSVLCEIAEEEAGVQIHKKVLWDFRGVNIWMWEGEKKERSDEVKEKWWSQTYHESTVRFSWCETAVLQVCE